MYRIKLFVDAHVFDEKYQGTRTFLKGLYTQMLTHSSIELYLAAYDIDNLKQEFNNDHRIHYLKYKSTSKFFRLFFDIPQLAKKNNIDIAHYQYISPAFKVSKEIVTIHDLLFNDFKNDFSLSYRLSKNFLFRRSAQRADLITTVSDYSKGKIAEHYQIDEQDIFLTPNGIDKIFFEYNPHNSSVDIKQKYNLDRYILLVSRIEPRKNHLSLLKAYIELSLPQKDISLVLIGKNDLIYTDFENYYQSLPENVKNKILRLENTDFQELLNFYHHADLFIYPSKAEGFGIPPLEAAAMKIDTLCSNTTAMSDFYFFEDNLFDPLDIEELKKKITFALAHKNNSEKKTKIARIIESKYDWKKIAEDFSIKIHSLF